MGAAISRLAAGDRGRLQELLRIYQESIEPSEQKPPEAIEKLLAGDTHEFLVATSDDVVVGFAMPFFPRGVECWLLDYMAVQSTIRSSGVGTALFAAAVGAARRRSRTGPALIEIDKPLAGSPTTGDSLRRQRFYAKCGCRRISGLEYLLPHIGHGPPPPMHLLLHRATPSTSSISRDVLRSWLSALYSQLYSCRADDPRIAAMLAPLPETVSLDEIG